MNKDIFLSLTRNFTSFSEEDAKKLNALLQKFPYSQVIRNLAARSAQDHQLDLQQNQLHTCAVYAADRSVLKWLMTVPRELKSTEIINKEVSATSMLTQPPIVKDEQPIISQPPHVVVLPVENSDLQGDELINEVFHDLKTLKKLKHSFEVSLEKFEKKKVQLDSIPVTDAFIEEIKHTHKKIKTEDIKQKEQIEIIDQFIKTQPSIKAKTKPAAEVVDLSDKSLEHTDKFVSETLVEILLKQGKTEKAIEVLKKLIWKFPQKKTYFAARIEDLRR